MLLQVSICPPTLLAIVISTVTTTEAFSPRWVNSPPVKEILPCSGQFKHWGRNVNTSSDWSYFTLSMSWPPTFCLTRRDENCVIPENVINWSIHGLWPSNKPGYGPHDCSKTAVFNSSSLNGIEDSLNKYWPNLLVDEQHYSFWHHEWCTHGTCAHNITSVNDEYKYFDETIELFKLLNPYSALSDAGITPSKDKVYSGFDISMAIRKGYYVLPSLSCYHKEDGGVYLHEIHLCLEKDLRIRDCPEGVWNMSWTCENISNIHYPPIQHSGKGFFYVNLES